MQFDLSELKKRNLIWNGKHLPYNPNLVDRSREMRKNPTPQERKLWYLYLRKIPNSVLRQRPIDHYIVDFYLPQQKLVIEIDGSQHYSESGDAYDSKRTEVLNAYGLQVIRFSNRDINFHFAEVCRRIGCYL